MDILYLWIPLLSFRCSNHLFELYVENFESYYIPQFVSSVAESATSSLESFLHFSYP